MPEKKRIRIVTICGHGMGTAILMQMLVTKALQTLNVPADIEAGNIAIARSYKLDKDLIVAGEEMGEVLTDVGLPVVLLANFIREEHAIERLKPVFNKNFGYKL